jgi:GTP-binding protein
MNHAWEMLKDAPEPTLESVPAALPEEDGNAFSIEREDDGTFCVTGRKIEKLVAMTDFANYEGLRRFQRIWRHLGIEGALRERGIKEGDSVRIAGVEFDFTD